MGTPPADPAASRCLILAHGAGSSAEFLARAFPASACRAETRYLDERTGSVETTARLIAQQVAAVRSRYRCVVVGGVSIGAHAAALAAAGSRPGAIDGCVLALPGWTGPAVESNPTAAAAAQVAALGPERVLAHLLADPALGGDWVVEELRQAWADRPTLVGELAAAARGTAPTPAQLRHLPMPALVIALAEDPMHPVAVASAWRDLIPGAALAVVGRQQPGPDRAVFGRTVGRWLDGLDPKGCAPEW